MSWYIVKTKPYATLKAKQYFEGLRVHCYVPHYPNFNTKKNNFKIKPLITGYVFVKLEGRIDYSIINENPFTTDVLKNGSNPILIPNNQMELMINHLKSLYKKNDFKNYSPGDLIVISHGVFSGVKGKVIEIKNNKVVLYLNASFKQVTVALN